MVSRFPFPLNAVHAIEVVARRGSLAAAAEELGVTPGAVSQHLRRAEERLGMVLFERTARGLVPTPALAAILPQLNAGFAALHDGIAALRNDSEGVLTVTVGSVFASRWLVWRIGRFSAQHPDIQLRMVVTGEVLDLKRHDIDCAIRFGRGGWAGENADALGGDRFRPVAAPALAPRLRTPADLARVPVITDTTTMLSWSDWFRAAGIDDPPTLTGPTFDDPALAFDAAISGQAVLMAVDLMSADAVSDGRLVRPFEATAGGDVQYWFVTSADRREPRKVRLFRDWLKREIPESVNGYVAQMARGAWAPADI